jgi:hypothetical protein
MARDSLIAGPQNRRGFHPEALDIQDDDSSESGSSFGSSDADEMLNAITEDRYSMLTLSRLNIRSPLSAWNLSQVDPVDVPPPLVIDKSNRLVTDTRNPPRP